MAAVATRKGINGDDGISPSSSILLLFFLSHRRWRVILLQLCYVTLDVDMR
ncbi:hypothetical protein Lalb_Chr18g0050761 [Lupinus albus]|uniref:Uncharacterized protein n=1 Tax=Lupinus albus TaxID=3870 RepID=A0A6A4NYA2_LUPAL|nr:hypothetical protein Lalb_Chr18g0050761 [Lupinus albus]